MPHGSNPLRTSRGGNGGSGFTHLSTSDWKLMYAFRKENVGIENDYFIGAPSKMGGCDKKKYGKILTERDLIERKKLVNMIKWCPTVFKGGKWR